jgi:hypothetical protein
VDIQKAWDRGKDGEACQLEKDQLTGKERKVNKKDDREKFRGKELVPLIRASDPENPVPYQRFALNETNDEKTPRDNHESGKIAYEGCEEAAVKSLMCPHAGLFDRKGDKQGQRQKDFRPVMADVLAEDMKDLAHVRAS